MSDPTTDSTAILNPASHRSSLHTHTSQSNDHPRSTRFVHRFMIALVLLFVLIIAVIAIAWLIIHPRSPVFTVHSFSISNFTLSESRVQADYDIELSINNPNKKASLLIDHFCGRVLYENTIISETCMKPVFLEKMGHRSLSSRFPKDSSVSSVKRKVSNSIRKDYFSKSVLNLNVNMNIRTRFSCGIWPSKETHVEVSCKKLSVEFLIAERSGTGKLRGGAKACFSTVD